MIVKQGILEEVERTNERTSRTTIWSLGGSGCVVKYGECILYIDPYLAIPDSSLGIHRGVSIPFPPEQIRKAKALLATHEHIDHCDELTVKAFQRNTDAIFIGPPSCSDKALKWGYESARIVTMRPGDKFNVTPEIQILAFESHDSYEPSALTYLVTTPCGNIFHGGDTSHFIGLQQIGRNYAIAVALLNFGKQIPSPERPYYMNAEALSQSARDLNASIVIPIHWDIWVEAKEDPESIRPFLDAISPASHLRILKVGDRYDF